MRRVVAVVMLMLLLSGCGGTITISFDSQLLFLQAASSSSLPRTGFTLEPGASATVNIAIPPHLRSAHLRHTVEVVTNTSGALDLLWLDPGSLTPLASTSGPAFFAPGWAGVRSGGFVSAHASAHEAELDLGSLDVAPAGIGVLGSCRGPCISMRADVAQVSVRVRNRSPYPAHVDLYAFVGAFVDAAEPNNAHPQAATPVPSGGYAAGVLETLGDRDYFYLPHAGRVDLFERAGYASNLRVGVVHPFTHAITELSVRSGGFFDVFGPSIVVVYSSPLAPRASAYGTYWLAYR